MHSSRGSFLSALITAGCFATALGATGCSSGASPDAGDAAVPRDASEASVATDVPIAVDAGDDLAAPDDVAVDDDVATDALPSDDVPSVDDVPSPPADAGDDSGSTGRPHAIDIGMCGWVDQFPSFGLFRTAEAAPPSEPRICHIYTYWNIARRDPPGGTRTHTMTGLTQWMNQAATYCDDVLITFQGDQTSSESPPSTSAFEAAFVAFQHLSDAGQPFAAWRGKFSYTAWNEPNNQANAGSGLGANLSAEQAADYYLAARRNCSPASGCRVAAGDFASNNPHSGDTWRNCADDNDPANTPSHCAAMSSYATSSTPSYLDRYKNRIAVNAAMYGLPASFRPEYFTYHAWHDVNDYIDNRTQCSDYTSCVTRRLIESLGGTWSGAEIWDDEVGVGLQNSTPPDRTTLQPCGAAFLIRLTELSPRITRIYYQLFVLNNGPLYDGTTIRPAGTVLATRSRTYAGASCAPTGL